MLAAVRAKSEGCPFAISLINDPTMVSLLDPLNIDAFINPRATTVSSILRHIRRGKVRAVYSIGDAEAEVIEAEVLSTSPLAGAALRDIDFPEGVLLGGVKTGNRIRKPVGSLRIEAGDVVVIFALAADVAAVEKMLQVSIDYF
jgi:trk system potassium uptake protein TrkA